MVVVVVVSFSPVSDVSQFLPFQPFTHLQKYEAVPLLTHFPYWVQGLLSQSSISSVHCLPVHPVVQLQTAERPISQQTPPFAHSKSSQWSHVSGAGTKHSSQISFSWVLAPTGEFATGLKLSFPPADKKQPLDLFRLGSSFAFVSGNLRNSAASPHISAVSMGHRP